MPKITKKYVITGGPCTGKSTLIKALSKKNYTTIPEVASLLIDEALIKHLEHPAKNRSDFQNKIIDKQLELESHTKSIVFLDRGLPDGMVYYKLDKIEIPEKLTCEAKNNQYSAIFILDFIKNENGEIFYEKTTSRTEILETAQKLQLLLHETYNELGYLLISVPSMSVQSRAEFILNKIKELEQNL